MKRYKLLIVDDEALIRSGLRARIAFFGFPDLDVEEAGSGAEALERFRAGDYAIAIVDLIESGEHVRERVSVVSK